MKKRILVVAAHPDDEVLGCGGTVALRNSLGWEAHLLIMTKGIAGRKTEDVGIQQNALHAEMKKATDTLGFRSVKNLDFPDNRMDTVSRMDVAQQITECLAQLRPNVIFTHHPGDYNWDHTITFESLMMAARSSPGEFAPDEILTFEVLSSTERAWQEPSRAFHPNVYVDISKTIELKKQALRHYATEYRPYPHPRSAEGLEYLARKRGVEVGLEYAEAFHLIRRIEA